MGTNPGIFITFEGGEGVGKSTHINFLAETLETQGYEVLCLREPGGTAVGERLRSLVLDVAFDEMSDEAELFIYEAARAQLVTQIIKPALERGSIVLCDRFCDSTLAYQAYGRGLSKEMVQQVNDFASQGIYPQRTILLTCGSSALTGLQRATHHTEADRLESAGEAFHARVNEGFAEIARLNPERVRVVTSADRKGETARHIFVELEDLFAWMTDSTLINEEFFLRIEQGHYGNKRKTAPKEGE